MSIELHLKAARLIRAPRQQVWEAFCRLTDFNDWGEMGGPRLVFGLDPGGASYPVQARLLEARTGELVAIAGRYKKIQSFLVFAFSDDPQGTRVEVSESLKGWSLLWSRFRYSPKTLSQAHQDWLHELERELHPTRHGEQERLSPG